MHHLSLCLTALFLAVTPIASAQTLSPLTIGESDTEKTLDIATAPASVIDGIAQIDSEAAADGEAVLLDLTAQSAIAVSSQGANRDHDLVLVSQSGAIQIIVSRAAAGSRRLVAFSSPIAAIVQLPSGTAESTGFMPGAKISHEILGNQSTEIE